MKVYEIYSPMGKDYETVSFTVRPSSDYKLANADQDAEIIGNFLENLLINIPLATEAELRENPKFKKLVSLFEKV